MNGPSAGIANLSFDLPQDAKVGQVLILHVSVTDPSRVDAFELEAVLEIANPTPPSSGTFGKDRNRNTGLGGGDDPGPVTLPNITPVYREDWGTHDFDELSGVRVVGQGIKGNQEIYDFYVNCDNKHLLIAQKNPQRDPEMLRVQFSYSLVLYAMAMLTRERSKNTLNGDCPITEDRLEAFILEATRRLAPFILPTLEAMSSLDESN